MYKDKAYLSENSHQHTHFEQELLGHMMSVGKAVKKKIIKSVLLMSLEKLFELSTLTHSRVLKFHVIFTKLCTVLLDTYPFPFWPKFLLDLCSFLLISAISKFHQQW